MSQVTDAKDWGSTDTWEWIGEYQHRAGWTLFQHPVAWSGLLFPALPPSEPREAPAPLSSGQSPHRSLGCTLGSGPWSLESSRDSRGWESEITQGHPGHQAEWPQLSPNWSPALALCLGSC